MSFGCDFNELYSLGRKLGEGRYGTTFLCVEKASGKEFACKSISMEKLQEGDEEGIMREVEIMQHLRNHPNIITIKGVYVDDEAVHLVMELCKGGELFDRIQKKYYTEQKAAEVARVIIGVLETCHSSGVMHRDLKPENFLFVDETEDSPLRLIDFGLSVFFEPGDTFDEVVGSPYYIAPEVLLRDNYGPKADVWSAGVIIYAMLCGLPPFWAETNEGIFQQVLHGEVDFESYPWPSISVRAKDFLKKMLDRDTERRPTAHEVLSHPWINHERRKRRSL